MRLNESEQQRVVEAYARLRSVYDIAHEFGTNRKTVSAILERHGVKRRYNILTPRSVARAQRLYESGRSLADIGYLLSVDPKTVRNALLTAGVKLRPVGTNQWTRSSRLLP